MHNGTKIMTWSADIEHIGDAVCAIGAFDGVHIGHQFLINKMIEDAERRGVASVIVTFDKDPDEFFSHHKPVKKLLSNEARFEHLAKLGADYILSLPFDLELAGHTFDGFLEEYLLPFMKLQCIHVGCDFKLGAHSDGDVSKLVEWGKEHGCDCVGYDLRCMNDEIVTATRIRDLLAQGDVSKAAYLLGREHFVTGVVEHGRGEGEANFGIPTANVRLSVPYTPLKDGVYAGYVTVDGVRHPAAINVGLPPTFENAIDTLEPHIIDFEGDLYGKTVSVSFTERLRDLVKFSSNEELIATIGANVAWVREHLV